MPKNIHDYNTTNDEDVNEEVNFTIQTNTTILDMIKVYTSNEINLSASEVSWLDIIKDKFIYEDESEILPIPFLSITSPRNSLQFLIHIILSMGIHETEMNALCHPSFRACLRAVRLIGKQNDI